MLMDKAQLKIGEKIRQRRVIKGYSQEYMAFRLNISQNNYSKIEREQTEITVKKVYQIAEVLGVSVYELLPDSKHGTVLNLSNFREQLRRLLGLFRKNKAA